MKLLPQRWWAHPRRLFGALIIRIFSACASRLDTILRIAQSSSSHQRITLNSSESVAQSVVVQQVIASFLDQLSKDEAIPTTVVETLRAAATAGTLGQAQTIKAVRAQLKEVA